MTEMEETNCNHKWLFVEEELLNTPSVRAGVSLEQEMTFRQKQAMLIQTIGLKSGLTQLAVNTSVIFMHRFFMYRTVKTFPRIHLALGFAFAGGKVEESARKLEHLIRTAVEVIRHNRNKEFLDKSDQLTYEMDCQWRPKMQILFENNCNIESPAYLEMRKLVLECETEIYAVIGFQLQIVHPHNYVIRMCALLGAENIKDISQYAYNLATASSQLTMLCLKYKPETIATMCLNIASKAHSFEPMKDSNVKWYQVLVPNTDFAEIEAVSEEFLHLIKGCPLLPSWMTNLGRMSRANNNRAMPGPSRGPGASSVSAPPGGRQNPSATSSTTAATNVPPSSSTAPVPQNFPARPQVTLAPLTSSQLADSRQLTAGRTVSSQLQNEAVISPGNKHISADTGANVPGASDAHVKDSAPSSHSRPHPSSGSAQMRPHHSSAALHAGAAQHQQHRVHPPGNGRPSTNQPVAPAGSSSSRAPTKPPVSVNSQGARPPQHPGQPGHHSASHQSLPRPTHEQVRLQEAGHARDQSRTYSDALRGPHDHARSRDHSRPHEVARSHDTSRHSHVHPDHQHDLGGDAKHISHSELSTNRSQSSRPEHISHGHSTNLSPTTSPSNTPTVKSTPPELPTDISQLMSSSGDNQEININVTTSSPESLVKSQSNVDKQRPAAGQGPKLSLTMYRERTNAKSRTPVEQSIPGDNVTVASVADDSYTLGANPESLTNSPADVSMRLGSGDLANFHKPQDSPNTPRIKIKVKRDPSSGERHSVKYADTGLKIKIKPLRTDTTAQPEGGEAGPSGVGMSSSASTPREEGEIVEDTPPSSGGDSEQKSERLKIRLSVPKSDHGSSYSRRESDQGSNGHSGEHEQSHRTHHHSHRTHHHSKSRKHSKHEKSRHEGKSSSKRSASALDYYDERPSKTSRSDTYSTSTGDVSHRHSSGYSEFASSNSSSRSHQQNTGFSIHDAFSSTMPHNIFDDDDDPAHAHPPVTPTVDAVPPHHEKFHQLMAQHRAKVESTRKPPLPKGPPPPQTSPPPPPPSPPTL
ncbi:hypothetical protein BsWGS_25705 [Bradybaena similaris]